MPADLQFSDPQRQTAADPSIGHHATQRTHRSLRAGLTALASIVPLLVAGCATEPVGPDYRVASTSGDFSIATAAAGPAVGAQVANFLETGGDGATGTATLADGNQAVVTLGPRYFAASGQWCRRYRVLTGDAAPRTPGESLIACRGPDGWRQTRPVVVTAIDRR
jgi:hypothetical protein